MESRRNFFKKVSLLGLGPFISINDLSIIQRWTHTHVEEFIERMDPLISFPENPDEWSAFREKLHAWRIKTRKELNYDGTTYDDKQFLWTQRNFSCYFLMMYDRDFFDTQSMEYTVDKIISRGAHEFGGYDSVVLWHAYPRIGLDERNQFDYYRDMPGGLKGIRNVVDQFHNHGIKVFVAYCPWDKDTRREPDADPQSLANILKEIDGDGIFLDTLKAAGAEFTSQLHNFKEEGIALESELALDVEELQHHHLSWAQWFNDRFVPGVLRNKWFEPRHVQHQIARWNEDHSTELQLAWMNGSGTMVWENVFGQWMAWKQRDRFTLKRMLPIQRKYWKIFCANQWTPLVPTSQYGVFASLWEGDGLRLWTLINRNQHNVSGELIETERVKNHLYVDLIRGQSATSTSKKNQIGLIGEIPARSVYCFIAGEKEKFGDDFASFLSEMQNITFPITEERHEQADSGPRLKHVATPERKNDFKSEAMVEIDPASFLLTTTVLSREVGSYESSLPIQLSLNAPIRYNRTGNVPHLAADITPVTNKAYYDFIKATGYAPVIKHNFLQHWTDNFYPAHKENHPVVWVDITDARAYCEWAGKRLPTEEEWQFIAQGYDNLVYPWGKDMVTANCNSNGNDTTDVYAHPEGLSPFGCLDMCGNTWELTESEYADDHNRFCMIKGGSYFKASGSIWYTQGGPQPSTNSIKVLLLYPGLDRSSTIGFRCVRDLE